MKLLLPLDSRVEDTQGFSILDCITQENDYYRTYESFPFQRKGFRGGCFVNSTLYVCNSFSVKAYQIENVGDNYRFKLLWQLQQPEWLMGRAANADLHTLHYDNSKGVLLLANSFMDAIDEISLDGCFLQRQFLWEMSDRIRGLVASRDPAAPDLCHINHISTAFGQTFVTLGNLNRTGKGAVVHRETGIFVIDELARPHDGVFWNDEFWITETSAYRLRVYSGIHSVDDFKRNEYRLIDLSPYVNNRHKFWCRGLHITEDRVFLGCSQFQDRENDDPEMPASHILEIDKLTGEVINRFDVAGSDFLRRPVLFSLLPIDKCFDSKNNSQVTVMTKQQDAREKMIEELSSLEQKLLQANKDHSRKFTKDLLIVQNRLYAQLESLTWLQRRLAIKGQLPPLRGWATSPDVLLRLHTHIMATRPHVVVEFGSGASTLVIADALRQNRVGKLVSIEHSDHYGAQTLSTLQAEFLEGWVDLRIGALEAWDGEHLNPEDAENPSRWYSLSLLEGVENVDLLWVDGPPGATCLFSRYPALPALSHKLTPSAEVWMDDTIRQEEKDICERWAADHGFELEYSPLEKGLGRLTRPGAKTLHPVKMPQVGFNVSRDDEHPERVFGLDFSLPEDNGNK